MNSVSNLKNISDSDLIKNTKILARSEREFGVAVLHHLREIERRKAYSAMGIKSLYDYCVDELGYSGGAAHRRIDAMKLLQEMPEIEEIILDGKLNFSTITQIQTFVRKENKIAEEPITRDEKKEILNTMEGKSRRQVDRELMKRSVQSEAHFQEKARVVSETHTELKLILTEETIQSLETLKGYLAHSHPGMGMSELVSYLAKFGIEKLNPARELKKTKITSDIQPDTESDESEKNVNPVRSVEKSPHQNSNPFPPVEMSSLRSRYIPTALRRQVFQRDQGKCSKCGSKYG